MVSGALVLVGDATVSFVVPEETMAAARDELRRRLVAKSPGASDKERERLLARLARLADLFDWGHIDEAEYRRSRADAEAALAALPDQESKLVAFDRARAVVRSLPESIAAASPERLQRLFAMMVERVDTADRRVVRVVWRPEVRPFLSAAADGAALLVLAPLEGLGGATAASADQLDWYAAAGRGSEKLPPPSKGVGVIGEGSVCLNGRRLQDTRASCSSSATSSSPTKRRLSDVIFSISPMPASFERYSAAASARLCLIQALAASLYGSFRHNVPGLDAHGRGLAVIVSERQTIT